MPIMPRDYDAECVRRRFDEIGLNLRYARTPVEREAWFGRLHILEVALAKAQQLRDAAIGNQIERLVLQGLEEPPLSLAAELTEPSLGRLNPRERAIGRFIHQQGWSVLRNGWPDLLVFQTVRGLPCASFQCFGLEVKGRGDWLTERQRAVHSVLEMQGVPVLVATTPADALRQMEKKGIVS
jgi:hypothetical protein